MHICKCISPIQIVKSMNDVNCHEHEIFVHFIFRNFERHILYDFDDFFNYLESILVGTLKVRYFLTSKMSKI